VALAYALAICVAAVVINFTQEYSLLWRALAADVGATLVIFAFGTVFRNSSFYDPYWSVTPPILLLYWCGELVLSDPRIAFLFLITLFWSLRLTHNWMRSWTGLDHEDWRYRNFKESTGVFYPLVDLFGIQLAPTLMVFLGCLPFYWLSSSTQTNWQFIDYLWVLIGFSGVYLEMRADNVLRDFKLTNTQPGKVLDYDVWGLCRHPNYLGELSFWFVIGSAGFLGTKDPLVWIGFVVMLALFVFYSVPALDKKLMESKTDYEEYKKSVWSLIPIKKRRADGGL
jgi:steroid 5-alpha reductase family enzyme